MTLRISPLRYLALCSLICMGFSPALGAEGSVGALPVLELFTSQGCSSCPPADALMRDYSSRRDVVALTLPVDYWDYLGWKDTLASPNFSARQRSYARARGDGGVYTPQTVVNGMVHVVGSHKADIDKALGQTKEALSDQRIAVELRAEPGGFVVDIGGGRPPRPGTSGTVWIAAVHPSIDVDITRGENKGRKITYYNVVRQLINVGSWNGQPATIKIEPATMKLQPQERYAVILQQSTSGPIVGAAWMTAPSY
jgi:hypothetical protein